MLNGFKSIGRLALIGSGSEIGQALVTKLVADNSPEVILIGRDGDFGLDITNKAAREGLVNQLFGKGDLDLAIIAVGVLGNNSAKSEIENLLDVMDVNYLGTVHLLALIAERMQVQAHGTILVISSFAQVRPRNDNFAYGSTKAGLDFYARGLAAKLRGTGVEVKILRPGFVKSKMTAGMTVAPFAITTEECATFAMKALKSKKTVTWAPSLLKYVAVVFATMPAALFRKISQR